MNRPASEGTTNPGLICLRGRGYLTWGCPTGATLPLAAFFCWSSHVTSAWRQGDTIGQTTGTLTSVSCQCEAPDIYTCLFWCLQVLPSVCRVLLGCVGSVTRQTQMT